MGWSEFRPTGLTYSNSDATGGYTLITPVGGDGVYLVDDIGRIVHRWQAELFQPGYGYLLENGNLLVRGAPLTVDEEGYGQPRGSADILLELDWNGNEIWRLEHPSFHHDMVRLANGNTILLIWEKCPEEIHKQILGGLAPAIQQSINSRPEHLQWLLAGLGVGGRPRDLTGFLSDAFIEVNPAGDEIRRWHAYEHLNPLKHQICCCEFPLEWSHGNAIEKISENEMLFSFREISTVMKVSWPDGEVLWEWGQNIVSHQHDPTVTPEGNILIFDNGTHHATTPRSRVVEVNPKNNDIVWEYRPRMVFSFFSGTIGGCERVRNGNTLICEGQSGRVFEVTKNGDVCWEFVSPWLIRWKKVYASMFFRAHRYYADSPQLAGRKLDGTGWDELNHKLGLIK